MTTGKDKQATKKIMVAMSGGVDSSVTAALLKAEGHDVFGLYMALAQPDQQDQIERVRKIADFLDIRVHVVDLAADFAENVLAYFSGSYARGLTPNPCVICNPSIKFGKLLENGMALGAELMATGHYARIIKNEDGRVRLLKGDDPYKDQSYFLHRLSQAQLQRLCFPLGETAKEEVYRIAGQLGLKEMHSKESQDVCFLQGKSVDDFLAEKLPDTPKTGDIVDRRGHLLGKHKGIYRYTVGQRRGLGIPDATPYYVTKIDYFNNQVIVGKEEELWLGSLVVKNLSWTTGELPELPARFEVKIRYRHKPAKALVSGDGQRVTVNFDEPQRAITPGQFAVFYKGDVVVGGGEIAS